VWDQWYTDGVVRAAQRGALGDLYHFLLSASWQRLLGIILLAYVLANVLFGSIYMLSGGVAHAGGAPSPTLLLQRPGWIAVQLSAKMAFCRRTSVRS
jgi:hypothetical protein